MLSPRRFFEPSPLERGTLLFGLLTGIFGVVLAVSEFSKDPQLDFHAYYFAGQKVLRGEDFVGTALHEGTFLTVKEYVYPPITAPVFVPYGLFPSWEFPYVLNILLLSAVFFLLARLTIRFVESHGRSMARTDRWFVAGFFLLSGHSVLGLYRGNVDPIILLLLASGFLALERNEQVTGGVLWATAALFKLFPAFLGVYLLYRRTYRAIGAALVTGVGLMLLGVLVFGVDAHVEFFEFILNERSRKGLFEGGLDLNERMFTLRRPLSQVLPLSGNQLIVVATALAAPVVAYLYWAAESALDRAVAFLGTMLVLLITIVPSTLNYVVYLYFPLVALLYLAEDRRTKRLYAVGLVLVSLPLFPEHIVAFVDALSLPSVVADAITGVVRAVLTYASIPLMGFLVLIGAAVRHVRLPEAEPDTGSDA